MKYNFPATRFVGGPLSKQVEHFISEVNEIRNEPMYSDAWWDEVADLKHSLETLTRGHEEEMKAAMMRVIHKNTTRGYYRAPDVSDGDYTMEHGKVVHLPVPNLLRRTVCQGYEPLSRVLDDALDQAQNGKGSERHGQGLPFKDQPIMNIPKLQNSDIGLMYQAIKKLQESQRMDKDAAVRERLGAINYIAASILFLENES